ncbi:SepL/TyeA/HrpJ family type III secretion system protein [Candidatus Williamhamiltonella defendens]|uniref:SepL/TyeA/HrpJ family type III secretion system gatekeeper n=1 Tax=Candidatus Hamiltonella defensa (Bemisia tabaci) TaxID=672795 RepID=A0A249DZT8_9ENTR|nr:SepL/TyeA/HrpJ family type III secretion system protein [Candidatus Hamiltonella defensa]ASX26292.1 SepL/TyeA/HrpJ family type III secretion system gatekeeper [Candidatus Hamiltonella defensa (Bemisia tabaci)]CED79455.1 Secretion system apparatus protein ssaL [Candidatus Hamiltonella defensa (Bemisia tabaci)]
MSTINSHHSLLINDIDHRQSAESEKKTTIAHQISPGSSVMEAIFEQQVQLSSQTETIEMMGLKIGEYYKQLKNTRSERSKNLLLQFIESQGKDGFNDLLKKNSSHHANSDLLLAQQILQTGFLLTQQGHNPLRRRQLSKQLADLMEQEGWEISLFGLLEFNEMPTENFSRLRRLFQQVIDDEEYSVINFFEKIKEWADRKRRIRVLLRAMAFELNSQPAPEKGRRLKIMIDRLKRLLLFLSLDERCEVMASCYGLEGDVLLSQILEITAQSWVFKDWLEERLDDAFNLENLQKRELIFDLTRLFKIMPDGCFTDDDHREQILEAFSSFEC